MLMSLAAADANSIVECINQLTETIANPNIDLFTAVSLVIAIAGSTYAAINGTKIAYTSGVERYRQQFGQVDEEVKKQGEKGFNNPSDYRNVIKIGTKCEDWFRFWDGLLIVPTVTFLLISFLIAIITLYYSWFNNKKPPCYWHIYKWFIVFQIVVNILSMIWLFWVHNRIQNRFKKYMDLNKREPLM